MAGRPGTYIRQADSENREELTKLFARNPEVAGLSSAYIRNKVKEMLNIPDLYLGPQVNYLGILKLYDAIKKLKGIKT